MLSHYLLYAVLPLILMADFIYAMGSRKRFVERLRHSHPDTYRDLGRPQPGFSFFDKDSRKSQQELTLFLRSDEVELLGDPQLVKLKRQTNLFNQLVWAIGAVGLLRVLLEWLR